MRLGTGIMPISALIGLALTIVHLALAIAGPWLAPFGQSAIVGAPWEPFSGVFWLGTDILGRDMLSLLLHGARTTVFVALISTALGFLIGITLGFMAAIVGGWVDHALSRAIDVLMSIPTLIFALVVLTVLPSSITIIVLVIATVDATRIFRLSRAIGMDIGAMDFVEVARLRKENTAYILAREILPNALPPLCAEFGLRLCYSILFLSTLSFLGLGIQPPLADWGSMVRDNAQGIAFGLIFPVIPAIAIASLTIGINLLVDAYFNRAGRIGDAR